MTSNNWIELNKIFISLPEEKLLALVAYGEARGEGIKGMKAVISVVKNRVKANGWFIDKNIATISTATHGVILKRFQFSCFFETDTNRIKLEELAKLWLKVPDIYSAKKLAEYTQLGAAYVLATTIFEDITNGATHYFEKHIETPKWAHKYMKVSEIGNHIFFR